MQKSRISYASVFGDDDGSDVENEDQVKQAEEEEKAKREAEEKAKKEADEAAAAAAAEADEDDWTAFESAGKKKKEKKKQKVAKKALAKKHHEEPTADIEIMVLPRNLTQACRAQFQESFIDEFGKQRTTPETADRPFDVWHGYVQVTLLRFSLADPAIHKLSQKEIDEPREADHPISDIRARLNSIRLPPINIKFNEAAQVAAIPDVDPKVVVEILPESRDDLIKLQEAIREEMAKTENLKEVEVKHAGGAPNFYLTLSKYTRDTKKVLDAWADLKPEDKVATECSVIICCLANDELPAAVSDDHKATFGADVQYTRRRLATAQLSKEAEQKEN